MKSQALAGRFLMVALVAIPALAVVIGRAPYLHDFGEWLYQAEIVRRLALGDPAVAAFSVAPYPVPNSLATIILAALNQLFPPLAAGRVFLVTLLLAWFPIIRLFMTRFVEPRWRDTATLCGYALAALSTFFWYGFVSYQLGLLLLTAFLAIYRENTRATTIAVFGLALFFAHAMAFLVFVLFLGARLLFGWQRSIVAGLVLPAACSLWFLAGRYLAAAEPQPMDAAWSGLIEALLYKGGYPAMLGTFRNFLLPEGVSLLENMPWLYWAGFGGNFLVAALLGVLMLAALYDFMSGRPGFETSSVPARQACALGLVLLLLAYLLGPYHFFGLINPGGRLLLPALLLALMLGGSTVMAVLRVLAWPVVLFSLVSSLAYLVLMDRSNDPGFSPVPPPRAGVQASQSVFDFNRQLYGSTRYTYFNYRVFAFAHRFEQIETAQFEAPAFRTGMLVKRQPSQ